MLIQAGRFEEVAMRSIVLLAVLVLVPAAATSASAEQPTIHLVDDERPPILERIGMRQDLLMVTVAPGGEWAAVALVMDEQSRQSTILLYSLGLEQPAELRVNGRVRDLLFAPDGMSVFGLLHRPAKKREGETYLIRIELDPAKVRRLLRAPPSARALDYWPARHALLIAARNEIRTLTLPDLRSGPLYRILGDNLAVASLGRRGRVLIGQETGIVEVDLDDPAGEDEMPARDRLSLPQPVVSLAAAIDGSRALARLADGAVYAVAFGPLRIDGSGTSAVLAERAKGPVLAPVEANVEPPREAVVTEPSAAIAGRESAAHEPEPAAPEPAMDTSDARPGATEPVPAPPDTELATPEPEAATAAGPSAAPETLDVTGAPPPQEPHQVLGRIVGPDADRVAAVVLLGPDNILREALRVRPGDDGWWWADGLSPGRYRVQLDGGGRTVLLTRPPFLLLEIRTGESVRAAEIRVVEAL